MHWHCHFKGQKWKRVIYLSWSEQIHKMTRAIKNTEHLSGWYCHENEENHENQGNFFCEHWIFDRHRQLVYFHNKKKYDKISDPVWSGLGQFTCKSFLFQRLTQNIKRNLSLMQGGDCCCSFGLTSKIIIFCLLGTNLC